ncbi:MAG: spore coat protein CotJB [Ruminococcus sp.]|nr:spore coat protein CotJB [Ruminococcus sp.]
MTSEQHKLMKKLQACSFALTEANLYLDSHPTCADGLAYFRRHKDEYEKARAEYEKKYGPLTACAAEGTRKWEWVTQPFPWEYKANEGGED